MAESVYIHSADYNISTDEIIVDGDCYDLEEPYSAYTLNCTIKKNGDYKEQYYSITGDWRHIFTFNVSDWSNGSCSVELWLSKGPTVLAAQSTTVTIDKVVTYSCKIEYYLDGNHLSELDDELTQDFEPGQTIIQKSTRVAEYSKEDSSGKRQIVTQWTLRIYGDVYAPGESANFDLRSDWEPVYKLDATYNIDYHLRATLKYQADKAISGTVPPDQPIDGYASTSSGDITGIKISSIKPESTIGATFKYWILTVEGIDYKFEPGESDLTFHGTTDGDVVHILKAYFKPKGATCWIYTSSGWKEAIPWICLGEDQSGNPIWKECSVYIYDNGWKPN